MLWGCKDNEMAEGEMLGGLFWDEDMVYDPIPGGACVSVFQSFVEQ